MVYNLLDFQCGRWILAKSERRLRKKPPRFKAFKWLSTQMGNRRQKRITKKSAFDRARCDLWRCEQIGSKCNKEVLQIRVIRHTVNASWIYEEAKRKSCHVFRLVPINIYSWIMDCWKAFIELHFIMCCCCCFCDADVGILICWPSIHSKHKIISPYFSSI